MKTCAFLLITLMLLSLTPASSAAATSPAPLVQISTTTGTYWTDAAGMRVDLLTRRQLSRQADRDIPQLVAQGVSFFVTVILCYLVVGTAAGFVESQWGVTIGSTNKPFSHALSKIGQLVFAFILAAMAYPLVQWISKTVLSNL